MGVKSTTRLTRTEAEARFVEMAMEGAVISLRRTFTNLVASMDRVELEDTLERLSDKRSGREEGGFDNFTIVG